MTPRTPRRLAGLALLLAVATTVVGCAAIPESGPVREAVDSEARDDVFRFTPAAPTQDATETEVVLGFLRAMQATPISSDVARAYLTPEAAQSWRPDRRTLVYSTGSTPLVEGPNEVSLTLSSFAELRGDGTFVARDGVPTVLDLTLRRVDGEWRIADPPDALLLPEFFFLDYYSSASVFYFDAAGVSAVPLPVWVPGEDQRATALVEALLRGPRDLATTGARSFLPPGAELAVSVPIDSEGVAGVDLRADLGDASADQLERLSAQIVLTLAQVPEITGVRISLDGIPLEIDGQSEVQPVDTWTALYPAGEQVSDQLFALRRGRLVVVGPSGVSEFGEPWGTTVTESADIAVSRGSERIAVVSPDRTSVSVGDLSSPEYALEQVATGSAFLAPRWDRSGQLWVAEEGAAAVSVIGGDTSTLPLQGLPARTRLLGFAISPDGARFAGVTRDGPDGPAEIVLGGVRRGPGGTVVTGVVDVAPLESVGPPVTGIRAITWDDPTHLNVLTRDDDGFEVRDLAIDGSGTADVDTGLTAPLVGVSARAVLGSGSDETPEYVLTDGGALFVRDDEGLWAQVDIGGIDAAAFPG